MSLYFHVITTSRPFQSDIIHIQSPSMSLLLTYSKSFLEFTAFLLHHLPVIAPNVVVLFFNNETTLQANHISTECAGYKQQLFNFDRKLSQKITIHENALVINLINYEISKVISFGYNKREICVLTSVENIYFKRWNMSGNDLVAHAYSNQLQFSIWTPRNKNYGVVTRISEKELIDLFQWSAFLRRDLTLPKGEWIEFVDNIEEDKNGIATNELNPDISDVPLAFVSGFRIGIYMILADKLSGNGMSYMHVPGTISMSKEFQYLAPMQYLDKRLSFRFFQSEGSSQLQMSLKIPKSGRVFTNAQPERYVVVVPRVVVKQTSSNLVLYQFLLKCLAVAVLILVAVLFTVLRYVFRWSLSDSLENITPVIYLFVNTFAGCLGTSAGNLIVTNTSERQLLIVNGVFAILFSSILSGILYEQLLMQEPIEFLYNTFLDVCLAKLSLAFPMELLSHFARTNPADDLSMKYATILIQQNDFMLNIILETAHLEYFLS